MLQNLFFHMPIPANEMELFSTYYNTTRNAPDIHLSHDLILALWRTFQNVTATGLKEDN